MIKLNKNREITQDYKLINAKYKLTTVETKFIMIVLSQLQKGDSNFIEYKISASELSHILQNKETDYKEAKKLAMSLMSKPFLIESKDPKNRGFIVFNWFSKVRYENGYFNVKIDSDLKPYLLELKNKFVNYNLKYILALNSNYSIRIYQMLKQKQKLKKHYIDIKELQELLKVPKSFLSFGKFKQGVLDVAQKELEKYTDIKFTYTIEKDGRKYKRLIFNIFENKKNTTQKAPKLSDSDNNSYTDFYGMNILYNNLIYKHIELISKYDDLLIVQFKNKEQLAFKDIYQLKDLIQNTLKI